MRDQARTVKNFLKDFERDIMNAHKPPVIHKAFAVTRVCHYCPNCAMPPNDWTPIFSAGGNHFKCKCGTLVTVPKESKAATDKDLKAFHRAWRQAFGKLSKKWA